MRPLIFLLNNFAHDLLTGLWLSSFLVLILLHGAEPPAQTPAVRQLGNLFFWLQQASLAGVAATGVLRYLDNKHGHSRQVTPQTRSRVLVIKHLVLGGIFLLGTALALSWR